LGEKPHAKQSFQLESEWMNNFCFYFVVARWKKPSLKFSPVSVLVISYMYVYFPVFMGLFFNIRVWPKQFAHMLQTGAHKQNPNFIN